MKTRTPAALIALIALIGCAPEVSFTAEDTDKATLGAGLQKGFLWGTSTAAHQIEGGLSNEWTDFEAGVHDDGEPHIKENQTSQVATDSWGDKFARDLAAMKELKANSYRFSVEWSRLEPSRGEWNSEAAAQYRGFVKELRANGIVPMVTLFHFTQPKWVAAQGGFENRDTLEDFAKFSSRVAILLGDEVDLWCTVNEPNVYAFQGYILGVFPPGRKDDTAAAARVIANLIEAHALATKQLRAHDTVDADGDGHATQVGLAHHVRVLQPATSSVLDTTIAGLSDDFFNEAIVRAGRTGRIQMTVPGTIEIDRTVEGLAGSFDYLGINYYTRDHVRADLSEASLSKQYVPEGRDRNDLGWDIYPEGLYQFMKRFSAYGWPIYITENGMADETGERRPAYLRSHIHALERASLEGVDIRGYFHWSLMDNFEWAEGYHAKFGLFKIDRADPKLTRQRTPAVDTFLEIGEQIPK